MDKNEIKAIFESLGFTLVISSDEDITLKLGLNDEYDKKRKNIAVNIKNDGWIYICCHNYSPKNDFERVFKGKINNHLQILVSLRLCFPGYPFIEEKPNKHFNKNEWIFCSLINQGYKQSDINKFTVDFIV